MTRSQAERQAMDKYVDMWGIDWVKEHAKHIGSESCNRPDGLYEFRLVNWTEPPDEFYPDGLPPNPQGEKGFTAMRRYSIEMEKPISAFTEEDYYAIGIRDLSL